MQESSQKILWVCPVELGAKEVRLSEAHLAEELPLY